MMSTIPPGNEILWFIIACAWVGSLLLCGSVCYRRGLNAKKVALESMSFKQALKWLLTKEQYRHMKDIRNLRKDLNVLKDVEIPEPDSDLWVEIK